MTAVLRAAAALLASLLTGVILVASAAPASAHATVVSSNPADGSHVDSVPDVLTVELSEPVTVVDGSASVITAEGERMRLSGVRLENGNRRVVIDPADGLGDNAYLATVRTVSADTHVISLSIRFTVGSVTDLSGIPKATEASSTAVRWGGVAKTAVYLGVILTAGLLLAARMVWPEVLSGNRFSRTHQAGAVILLLGLLGRFSVLSAQHAGGLSAVTTDVAGDVLRTSAGWSIALAAVLNLCVAGGVTRLRGGRYTGYLAA
ncbi:MAG: copper resistance protein CopC, partial [Gordonia amarae]